eukprot:TRINITY_DN10062_c0_g1_i1.p1 TRINITY_DN10062_c0_g1~~TRINITY_DN10062_c0_g1_i1.p1  ORF type:complete len:150 (+),score=28.00 TRINITY_DN10062_c0_g1_i1:63-512(+)
MCIRDRRRVHGLLCGLLLGLNKNTASNSASDAQPSLSTKNVYSSEECEMVQRCRICSFPDMKHIKECASSGYVSVTKCTKVNRDNEDDRLVYTLNEPCLEMKSIFGSFNIFVISTFIFGILSLHSLFRYRERIKKRFYKKLNIEPGITI